jgi:hypothetical protein
MNRSVLWKTGKPLVFDKPPGWMRVLEIPFSRLIFLWKKGGSLGNCCSSRFSLDDWLESPVPNLLPTAPPNESRETEWRTGRRHGRWLRGSSASLLASTPPHLHVLNSSASSPSRLLAVRGWAAGLCCEPPEPTASAADCSRVDQEVAVAAPARIFFIAGQRYICLLLLSSRFQYRVQTSIE